MSCRLTLTTNSSETRHAGSAIVGDGARSRTSQIGKLGFAAGGCLCGCNSIEQYPKRGGVVGVTVFAVFGLE